MLANKDILSAIGKYIESKHRLGEQSGGSGHKGYVSFRVDDYEVHDIEDNKTEVSFKYTLITETEFTYYPDNPPYEDYFEEMIIIDT